MECGNPCNGLLERYGSGTSQDTELDAKAKTDATLEEAMDGDDTIYGHLGNLRISGHDSSLQLDLDMKSSEILPE